MRDNHRQPTKADQRSDCEDQRIDPQNADKEALEGADHGGEQNADQQRGQHANADDLEGNDPRERRKRADRKIELACDHSHSDAHRDDPDQNGAIEQRCDAIRSVVVGQLQREHQIDDRHEGRPNREIDQCVPPAHSRLRWSR